MSFSKRVFVTFVASMIAAACSSDDGVDVTSEVLAQQAGKAAVADAGLVGDGGTFVSPLSGTATTGKCLSYSKGDAGMCSGYFCGVTEAQLTAAMPTDSVCPLPTEVCQGAITAAVAQCTRSTVIANLGKPVDPLKPQIQECFYKNEALKAKVSTSCLGCYLNVATCAASHCLVECLSDSPACDTCRKKNNCDAPIFECAKLPSPL